MSEPKETRAGAKPRRRYDEAFKRKAVELSERGDRVIGELARELGLSEDALYRWRREYGVSARQGAAAPPGPPRSVTDLERENRDLRAKLADMETREIILKKSLGILSEAPGSGMPKWKR
jgi:transposase-like protein